MRGVKEDASSPSGDDGCVVFSTGGSARAGRGEGRGRRECGL